MKPGQALAAAALLLCSRMAGQDNPAAAYEAMLQKVKAGDFKVDFRAMRMACMAVPSCRPRATKEELSRLATPNHREGIAVGERLLEKGYINAEIHAALAGHYQAQGDAASAEKAAFHQTVFAALLQSILGSGNGRSQDTAWAIVSDREQYMVLSFLGYPYSGPNVQNVATISSGRHKYILWQVKNAQGALTKLYFNIDAFRDKSMLGKE